MKIEVLENHRIKVSLTVNDLMYYNLNPETLSPNSPELNKFLFNVMEDVKKETGFNPYNGQIVVEAVRSNSGITLYITRVETKQGQTKKYDPKKIKAVSAKKKHSYNPGGTYLFENFDSLCDVLRILDDKSLLGGSVYSYNDKWYYISEKTANTEHIHFLLCEYCTNYGGNLYTETFLNEHGKMIAKNETLLTMAEGVKKIYEGEQSENIGN